MASRPLELLATSDVAGRPDTLRVMLHQGHAFVSHPLAVGGDVRAIAEADPDPGPG